VKTLWARLLTNLDHTINGMIILCKIVPLEIEKMANEQLVFACSNSLPKSARREGRKEPYLRSI